MATAVIQIIFFMFKKKNFFSFFIRGYIIKCYEKLTKNFAPKLKCQSIKNLITSLLGCDIEDLDQKIDWFGQNTDWF